MWFVCKVTKQTTYKAYKYWKWIVINADFLREFKLWVHKHKLKNKQERKIMSHA